MEELLAFIAEDALASSQLALGMHVGIRGLKNARAIVKHLGPIHSAPGEYVGVELDRPLGKNDGTIDNVTYFLAKAKHGLFVRPYNVFVQAERSVVDRTGGYVSKQELLANGLKGSMWARSTQAQRLSVVAKDGVRPDGSPTGGSVDRPLKSSPNAASATVSPGALQRLPEFDMSGTLKYEGSPAASSDTAALLVHLEEMPLRPPRAVERELVDTAGARGADGAQRLLAASRIASAGSEAVRVTSALSGRRPSNASSVSSVGAGPSTAIIAARPPAAPSVPGVGGGGGRATPQAQAHGSRTARGGGVGVAVQGRPGPSAPLQRRSVVSRALAQRMGPTGVEGSVRPVSGAPTALAGTASDPVATTDKDAEVRAELSAVPVDSVASTVPPVQAPSATSTASATTAPSNRAGITYGSRAPARGTERVKPAPTLAPASARSTPGKVLKDKEKAQAARRAASRGRVNVGHAAEKATMSVAGVGTPVTPHFSSGDRAHARALSVDRGLDAALSPGWKGLAGTRGSRPYHNSLAGALDSPSPSRSPRAPITRISGPDMVISPPGMGVGLGRSTVTVVSRMGAEMERESSLRVSPARPRADEDVVSAIVRTRVMGAHSGRKTRPATAESSSTAPSVASVSLQSRSPSNTVPATASSSSGSIGNGPTMSAAQFMALRAGGGGVGQGAGASAMPLARRILDDVLLAQMDRGREGGSGRGQSSSRGGGGGVPAGTPTPTSTAIPASRSAPPPIHSLANPVSPYYSLPKPAAGSLLESQAEEAALRALAATVLSPQRPKAPAAAPGGEERPGRTRSSAKASAQLQPHGQGMDILARLRARYGGGSLLEGLTAKALGVPGETEGHEKTDVGVTVKATSSSPAEGARVSAVLDRTRSPSRVGEGYSARAAAAKASSIAALGRGGPARRPPPAPLPLTPPALVQVPTQLEQPSLLTALGAVRVMNAPSSGSGGRGGEREDGPSGEARPIAAPPHLPRPVTPPMPGTVATTTGAASLPPSAPIATGAAGYILASAPQDLPSLPRAGGRANVNMKAMIRSYAGLCEKGFNSGHPDKPCQDAIVMLEHPDSDGLLLAVFDGHGEDGHCVAEFFKEHLPAAVFAHPAYASSVDAADNIPPPPQGDELRVMAEAGSVASPAAKASAKPAVGLPKPRRDVGRALKEVLLSVEQQLLARTYIDCSLSGCTGCVAVINGDTVTVANVGDSRAALFRRVSSPPAADGSPSPDRLVPMPITVDHKPTLAGETRRILLAGGRVHAITYEDGADGPVRVWLRNEDVPGLAMSRSLGDTIGKKAGVISTPDVYRYTLMPGEDAFLLLASDGLWEFTPQADVAAVISSTKATADAERRVYYAAVAAREAAMDEGVPPEAWPDMPEAEPQAHMARALDTLAEMAGSRFMQHEGVIDDISIILAEVGALPQ